MKNDRNIPVMPNIKTMLKDELTKFRIKDMGSAYRAYYIKNPAINLSQEAQSAIYEAYIPLTTYAFGADMAAYWQSRKAEGYMEKAEELVLVTDIDDELVGWTSYSLVNSDKAMIVYNDSSGIIPPHQKNKLMSTLYRERVSDCVERFSGTSTPLLFATRTETPIMYSMQKKLTQNLYPSPDYPTIEFISDQAMIIAEWLGQKDKLDKKSLIIRNAYSMLDELYGELPTSGDVALDKWISSQVGPLDAFLLIGEKN